MNRTVAFICFVVLAGLGIVGVVLLLLLRPDASATFTAFIIQILGLVTVGAGTFALLGQQGKKIESIEKQTNGNLSRRDAEIERLTNLLAKSQPIDVTAHDRQGEPIPAGMLRRDLRSTD